MDINDSCNAAMEEHLQAIEKFSEAMRSVALSVFLTDTLEEDDQVEIVTVCVPEGFIEDTRGRGGRIDTLAASYPSIRTRINLRNGYPAE